MTKETETETEMETEMETRWSPEEATKLHATAVRMFADHYPGHSTSKLARENCGGCALGGYGAEKGEGPNYSGWARLYVEARMTIPTKWRDAFSRELECDNPRYVDALKRSIATFGITWGGMGARG